MFGNLEWSCKVFNKKPIKAALAQCLAKVSPPQYETVYTTNTFQNQDLTTVEVRALA